MKRKTARFLLGEPKRFLSSRELESCSVFQEFMFWPRWGHRVIGRRRVGNDEIRYAWLHSFYLRFAEMRFRNDSLRMIGTERRLTVRTKAGTWRFRRFHPPGEEVVSGRKGGYSWRLANPAYAVKLDNGPKLEIQSKDGLAWTATTSWSFSSKLEIRYGGDDIKLLPEEMRTVAVALLNFYTGGP